MQTRELLFRVKLRHLRKGQIIFHHFCNSDHAFSKHNFTPTSKSVMCSISLCCVSVRPTVIETAVYVNSIGPVDPINMVSLPLNISLDSLSRVTECLYKPEQYLDNLYSCYSLNALSKKSPNSIFPWLSTSTH